MADELEQVQGMEEDYLETIKDLKANSVSKDDYAKLKEENKKLLNSLVNGQVLEESPIVQSRDIQEIRDDLFNHEHNNLEYVKLALELRDKVIEEGGEDPFLPFGHSISPTEYDRQTADKVAEVYKECIEYAEGNSEVFTNELMRRTRDVKLPNRR